MSTNLSSTSGIADFIYNSWTIPTAISGALIDCVDAARSHVSNYTGEDIGTTGIADKYQPAIIDFARADIVNLFNLDASSNDLSIAELSVGKTDSVMSAEQYKMLGEMKLKALGRKIQYAKSLS